MALRRGASAIGRSLRPGPSLESFGAPPRPWARGRVLPPLGGAPPLWRRSFESRADYDAYRAVVERSWMRRPDGAVVGDAWAVAPFTFSVDPMAPRLRLSTVPAARRGTAEASMVEAAFPLATDELLRTSVSDLGGWSTFRLSKFYEAVDALTADVAYRHTAAAPQAQGEEKKKNSLALVTAAHAHSRKVRPTVLTRDVSLRCYVVRAGGASLEVRTDAVQDVDGRGETLVNTCSTTMVALDRTTMRPMKGAVPSLVPPEAGSSGDADLFRLRCDVAATHQRARRRRADASLQLHHPMSHPPSADEMAQLHQLHRAQKLSTEEGKGRLKTVGDCTFKSSFVIYPEQRNVHGKLFGGYVVDQGFNIAFYAVNFFAAGRKVVPLGLDSATFTQPIAIGDHVTFTARVVHATMHTCRVNIAVTLRDPAHSERDPEKANRLVFVFATEAPNAGGVLPNAYNEILMHYDAVRTSALEGPDDDTAKRILDDA